MTEPMLDHEDMNRDHEESALAGRISKSRADRFYNRIRKNIQNYLDKRSGAVGKTGEYLLLVPDVFNLLWRLVNDKRVNGKNKVLLASSIAYYIFPFDILPEALTGPLGYFDDLIFGVYVLNRLLADTDPAILREHWAGKDDILETIQKVLGAADSLVSSDVLNRIKKMTR